MGARSGTLAALLVLFAATLAAGSVAGTGTTCAADGDRKLCLADVHLSTDRIAAGDSATLEITVGNEGDAAANASVVMNTVDPENVTESYTLREERLEPGEELTVSQRLDASTVGTHGLQVLVFDGAIDHRYDASEVRILEVEPRSDGLGGSVDRAEYALVALLGSLGVAGVIVYRYD
ncbi:CARDB domain-containing protein [Halorarum salinum]|uniref:CARDB domain-containing protein n=1 Tax=Halorarum salinum TaxID=2743089 RepID=A0A7D5QDB7_9EURY|nr:CARDB domain-containing protein [Halobaculum salinum]QLG63160.1 hypothetical protein HUG12_16035 [Halobaculum salinum]